MESRVHVIERLTDVSVNRRSLLAAAALGVAATRLSFGKAAAQDTSKIGIGVNYDTALFDHLRSSTTPFASPLIFENLIIRADDGSWAPWVAESWETAADGLKTTFKIRQGITFHDGSPLNAEAVKWFFDKARDPEGEHGFSSTYAPVTDITLDDEYTVSFVFSSRFAGFMDAIASSFAGLISPTSYESAGENFGVSVVIGSGPYKLESWVPSDTMVLTRYEEYTWAPADLATNLGPALCQTLEVRMLPEPATATAALETGQIDVLFSTSVQDYDRLKDGSDFQFLTPPKYGGDLLYMSMNMERAPFQDIAVRKAINHAIDKEGIAAAVFRNIAGVAAYGYLPPHFPAHYADAQSIGYAYNVDTAKQLLDEAGWAEADGVRSKDGASLSFKLIVGNTPEYVSTVQIVQANLEEIGIKLDVVMNTSTATLELAKAGDFDCYMGRWGYGSPDVLNFFFPSDAANNRSHINDPKLDEMLATATGAETIEELNAGFMAVDEYLIQQAYWAPIVFETDIVAVRSNVTGFGFNQYGDTTYPTDWARS